VSGFDAPAALGDVSFLYNNGDAPSWTQQPEGYARLVPGPVSRAHGTWSKAAGDGRYRCLVRWSTITTNQTGARPFSFSARLARTNSNWSGLKVDAFQPSAGVRNLEISQYTGSGTTATILATATSVGWQWNIWYWVELEVDGTSVKARLYPEAAAAPAWQVAATTTWSAAGAFGPGGFPRFSESPNIDIKRLEFIPLSQGLESVPPAAQDADWSLGQFTESK
jgi:hypothetical protein